MVRGTALEGSGAPRSKRSSHVPEVSRSIATELRGTAPEIVKGTEVATGAATEVVKCAAPEVVRGTAPEVVGVTAPDVVRGSAPEVASALWGASRQRRRNGQE